MTDVERAQPRENGRADAGAPVEPPDTDTLPVGAVVKPLVVEFTVFQVWAEAAGYTGLRAGTYSQGNWEAPLHGAAEYARFRALDGKRIRLTIEALE